MKKLVFLLFPLCLVCDAAMAKDGLIKGLCNAFGEERVIELYGVEHEAADTCMDKILSLCTHSVTRNRAPIYIYDFDVVRECVPQKGIPVTIKFYPLDEKVNNSLMHDTFVKTYCPGQRYLGAGAEYCR